MKADASQGTLVARPHIGRFPRVSKTQLAVLVVAWLISVGIGYWVYQPFASPAEAAVKGTPFSVRRGTLASTVNAPGSTVSTRQAKLTFGVAGKVAEIHVGVGTSVKAGQPLAKLDTTQLEIKLAQAQSSLRVAELKLQQTKAGATAEEIAAAQSAYDSAVAKYNEVAKGPTEAELRSAEQSVASARANLQKAQTDLAKLRAGPDPDEVRKAELDLERAKSSLWSTQINRDATCSRSKGYECAAANASVSGAEKSVTQAEINLEIARRGPTPEELAAAENAEASAAAALQAAEAKLAELKAGPAKSALASAQSAVESAKAQLLAKTRGATELEIAQAEEAVQQAQIAVRQAELDLKNATLNAPFDGVVASVGANVGEDIAAGGVMFSLVDPKTVRVDVNVAETDIARVAVGKPAQVIFDALTGQTFEGRVAAISPSATVQQGVASYVVSLEVETNGATLPIGMTASTNIIAEQKENVLMVPNRAIRVDGRNRVVDVVVGDKTETRVVRTGMSNDQFTEVVEGLSEGDQVLIRATSTTTPGGIGGRMMSAGPATSGPVMIQQVR
ncbi:MAG: efflux RND transporter periplasmic adaptor subunit [Chloroflexota bacterium]